MGFFANSKCIHKHNVIFTKTATKLLTILTNSFFHIWTLQATLKTVPIALDIYQRVNTPWTQDVNWTQNKRPEEVCVQRVAYGQALHLLQDHR